MVHVVVRVVVAEVAEHEAAEGRIGGVAEDRRKPRKKSAARGIETEGGITRRILSLGWSWWMPWMMKCMRRPKALSGSQWKISRWSQYSVRVQKATPPSEIRIICQTDQPFVAPIHSAATITGTKMIAGIAGCTREKKLRNSLLKSGGDADSRWVRSWASIWPNVSGAGPAVPQDAGTL